MIEQIIYWRSIWRPHLHREAASAKFKQHTDQELEAFKRSLRRRGERQFIRYR